MQNKATYIYHTIIALICLTFLGSYLNPTGLVNPDEMEHLRTSFLIFQGKIPFLDFFQHHHLLLSYLFAPVFEFVYRDPIIFLIARLFIYGLLLACIWYSIKILDCFKTNKAINRISFPFIFFFLALQYSHIFHFRPDTLMILFFLMGLCYFFRFMDKYQIKLLTFSFLCFTLSFFSLQKIITFYPVIFLTCLWFLYTKKLSIKQLLISAIPSALIALFYLSYLLLTGSFKAYFVCSFIVNKLLSQTLVHSFHVPTGHNIFPIYVCFFILPYLIWKHKDIKIILLTGLFMTAFLQACFLNPWPQYYLPLITLFAIILSLFFSSVQEKSYNLSFYSYLGSLIALSLILLHFIKITPHLSWYMKNYTRLLSFISPTDTVIDEFRHFNIWNPTTTWHEFHVHLAPKIDYEKLGLPKKNTFKTIVKNAPTIVDIGKRSTFSDLLLLHGYEQIPKDKTGFPWIIYKKKMNAKTSSKQPKS